jgi:DNA polymerase-3 subunit gamma/tau
MREAAALSERSIGFDGALAEMALLWHQVALAQTVPSAIADDDPEREALLSLAERTAADDVQLYYQIALHGRRDLALAPDELAGFSMTLLRMLAFHPSSGMDGSSPQATRPAGGAGKVRMPENAAAAAPVATAEPAVGQPDPGAAAKELLAKLTGGRAPAARVAAVAAAEPAPAEPVAVVPADITETAHYSAPAVAEAESRPEEPAVSHAAPLPWEDADSGADTAVSAPELLPSAQAPGAPAVAAKSEPDRAAQAFDGDWLSLIGELGPHMGAARMLAQNAVLKSFDGRCLALAVPENFRHLAVRDYQEKLKAVLAERFSGTLEVVVSVEDLGLETPAMRDARDREVQLAAARTSLEEDPVVQQFVRDFDATLLADTIQPVQES